MQLDKSTPHTAHLSFDSQNWIATDPLPRDQEQSLRLHQPHHIVSTTDPITGHDVMGTSGRPSIVDGILTIYFESEATRKAYKDIPNNHPVEKLPGVPSVEDDRGG
jgi:hypothetical protein